MRCVIQRVNKAAVSVNEKVISRIDRGLLILVGISHDDNLDDLDYIAKKVAGLKLFPALCGQEWKESASSLELEILSVSQFTLYAKTSKGTKPDFHRASNGSHSQPLYAEFLSKLRLLNGQDRVKDGAFGEMMTVELENDGPVTIILDSKDKAL